MERWRDVLKVPIYPHSQNLYKVAVSLCISPTSNSLIVPPANAIFFNGDRVEGTGNPVIEKLSDIQNVADTLVSKFGDSINAWVIQASTFNGPFAVYKDFVPSLNCYGEPKCYDPIGFPASTSTISILSSCLEEVIMVFYLLLNISVSSRYGTTYVSRSLLYFFGWREKVRSAIPGRKDGGCVSVSSSLSWGSPPKTIILGFSKGGTVLNQLLTELCYTEVGSNGHASCTQHRQFSSKTPDDREDTPIVPSTKESLINSIVDVHYVDVGLNSSGAYLTDCNVITQLSKRLARGGHPIRFVLHGTPRQWFDDKRSWIRDEKDRLLHLLESESRKLGGKLQVHEKFYFSNRSPDLEMHFKIIEELDLGL